MSDVDIRTMRSLEVRSSHTAGGSVLEVWYESVRDIPIRDLSVADLARSCRQGLFPDHIVPVAIEHLRDNPLAGDQYDGELIMSFRKVDREFWKRRPDLKTELSEIIAKFPVGESCC